MRRILLFAFAFAIVPIAIALVGVQAAQAVTATWTGATSNAWATGGNWSGTGGAAPAAGSDLVFPAGAAHLTTNNNIAAGRSFNSITISGNGYTLAGNSIALGAGNLSDTNAAGSNTVSLAVSIAATRTFSVSNASESLTISGVLSGAGGLTKTSAGTLILSGTNTYSGATTINGGILKISADNNLGTAPGGATAAQLTFGGGTLATTTSFALSSNRGIAFNSTGTIDVASGTTLTYGGIATGAGGLTKTSAGTLTISGANTYGGATTISLGTLKLGANNSVPSGSALTATGTFDLAGFADTIGSLAGGGTVTNSSGGANSTLTAGGDNTSTTFSGVMQDGQNAVAFTKAGTGTMTLSGTNSYSGATTINGGTLKISADNNLGAVPGGATAGQLTFGGGTLATTTSFALSSNRGIAFNSTGTIDVASGTTLTYGGIAAGAGGLTKTSAGTLTISGANTYGGATTISLGTLKLGANNSVPSGSALTATGTFDLAGFADTIGSLAGGGTVTNSSATASTLTAGGDNTSTTFSGVIQNGSGTVAITKSGTGTMTLSGTNTYSGVTTINAGTLQIANGGNLGAVPGSPTPGLLTFGGGTLATTTSFALSSNRGIAFNSTGTIDVAPGTTVSYGGIATGAGGLTKTNTGTLSLSGTSTYTGATTINAGTLQIANGGNLGAVPGSPTPGLLTFGGGTLATTTSFALSSNRGIAFNSTGTIDVASGTTVSYGGIAAGAGGLTKTSAGTLTLSGTNTYSGTTTVSAGTLLVNGSQGSSAISLNGGTLGGSGTVGAITSTASGGTIDPGTTTGILSSGNVNWSTGSPTFLVQLNGTTAGTGYDQLSTSGTINLTGATLSGAVGFTPTNGSNFTIINNTGGSAITGTFSGLAEGATVSLSGWSFKISYLGGSGHSVVLTAGTPVLALVGSVSPPAMLQSPGTDLAYTITFTNSGGITGSNIVISDPIPNNTDFKVGSATSNLGTTGLTLSVAYSNNGGATYAYAPVSAGGGAPVGYDRNVTNVRWTFTGTLSQTSPNNTGSVGYTARIQ
jgi:autotransporter-associated beta strand protein